MVRISMKGKSGVKTKESLGFLSSLTSTGVFKLCSFVIICQVTVSRSEKLFFC